MVALPPVDDEELLTVTLTGVEVRGDPKGGAAAEDCVTGVNSARGPYIG